MAMKALERIFQEPPSLLGLFQPGLDDAGLERVRQAIGIDALPTALEALYRWKDPPERLAASAPELLDTWHLLSSTQVVTAHQELRACFPGTDRALYDPRWVPFLRNASGDCLCVVADGAAQGEPGEPAPGVVLEVSQSTEDRPVRFGSVDRWLELTVEGLERDLLRVGEDGGLSPLDPIGWEAFLDENNPGYLNGDPASARGSEAPQEPPSPLRRLATAIGTFSIVAFAVIFRVFRGQLHRAGLLVIFLGLGVAGLFLLVVQVMVWRNNPAEVRGEEAVVRSESSESSRAEP